MRFAALTSAVTYALAMVLLRARATRDSLVVIVTLHKPPAGADPARSCRIRLGGADIARMGLGGIARLRSGVFGHLLLARAFKRAEAARLASLDYTSLVWAVLFGYIFFDRDTHPLHFRRRHPDSSSAR